LRQDVRNVATLRQDARDALDAEYPALPSGRNAGRSDARSVFADGRKGDGDSVKEQVRRLSGMMENMMKIQEAAITPNAPIVPNRPEPNVIPLDTYAI